MKSTMRPIVRVLWQATAIRSSVLVVACFGAAGLWAAAQSAAPSTRRAPASAGPADPKLIEDLVLANHILAIEGVFDAMGQVSVRHDRDPTRYLMAYARARRMTPARSSRAKRPSSGPASPPLTTGSRRATGRRRSVIRIDSPCRTRSSSALRRFFVSDIVAVFMRLL